MKVLKLLFMVVSVTGLSAFAIKKEVPEKVEEAFNKKFPEAKAVHWDQESDHEWEAAFKYGGHWYSANFMDDGTWKETEHDIKLKQLPDRVRISLFQKFQNYKIKEQEISETTNGILYECEIKKGKSKLEVAFDEKGELKKKEVLTGEDED
ncbi:PepSY-like domain-containing protein [Galbibacter sp. BG1]